MMLDISTGTWTGHDTADLTHWDDLCKILNEIMATGQADACRQEGNAEIHKSAAKDALGASCSHVDCTVITRHPFNELSQS